MFRSIAVALITMSCWCALPARAAAQDLLDPPSLDVSAPLNVRMTATAAGDWQTPLRVSPVVRGPLLPSLYVSLIGLQAYDGYSTIRGLSRGASESNPFIRTVTSREATLWAAKGGAAFVSIYVAERLWRQHRRGQAIVLMVVSNGLMAAAAARNASVIRAQQ